MRNLPNLITLLRLGLVPVMAYCLARGWYAAGLLTFLAAALSDLVDGYLARRLRIESRLGATLDPIADKLNMLVATLLLAWQQLVPPWLAIAIIARDVVIVAGALMYRAALGHIEIAPTRLSKINTFLEFSVLLLVMATAAGWIGRAVWMPALFIVVLLTVAASGAQYVWLWARKAFSERRVS
jgi:cardiolipin synthase